MKYKYPENIDQSPKRRKANDNPYEIFAVGINTDHPHFFVRFTDGTGEHRCLEITAELFQALNEFELRGLSFLNEVDNHYEQSELTEASLHERAADHQKSVEETVLQHLQSERLHSAIAQLPEVQRRRLVLCYFGNYTYEQIGEMGEKSLGIFS
ncbi:MAG: sigma-70 family RNA polymerase sigma factor [Lachnospiraceae bacterium]|nr:sigma-70 family RNA polymerase sigma factor [Lachnospiraceae bacterium]